MRTDKDVAKQTMVMGYVAKQLKYMSGFFKLLFVITKNKKVLNTANMSLISAAMIKYAERSKREEQWKKKK